MGIFRAAACETGDALNIVMLLTDGYGGIGGIAKFNRDFLQALDSCVNVERIHVFPRLIPQSFEEPIPESVVYDRKAARGKLAFVSRLSTHVLRSDRNNLVICGHLHLLPAAWLLARLRGARLALIIHGIETNVRSRRLLADLLARTVDTFIAVSHYSAEKFTSWSKVTMDRASILSNCVDLERFRHGPRDPRLVKRYGLQSSKVILTMGRLASSERRYKGFDQVIDVIPQLLERFPDLKYLIVGDGSDRDRLEKKSKSLGLSEKVIFTGHIPESEKVAHYNLADAYVMPSMGEGFGIVLIEAAACGIPVVGSKADGSREALLNGRLGRLIDPRSPRELIDAVTDVLKNGSTRMRDEAIEVFSTSRFNARVVEWCHAQMTNMCA
jgi:phosphatidylinositol alpha-1,6-mannosyltransferase